MSNFQLRDLPDHCSELSYFFASEYWLHIADWLSIASGIVNVEVDTIRHNPSFGWCSDADEHDYQRDVLLSRLATELTIFSFIWGSLESLIDHIVPQRNTRRMGKINAACDYLKNTFDPEPPLMFYKDLLGQFHDTIARIPYYRDIEKELRLQPYVGISGIGLYTVYRIRNTFAHGSLIMPEPPLGEDDKPVDPELIKVSSRLVLLSIQMLALAHYKNDSSQVDCWWRSDEHNTIDLKLFLRNVHLQEVHSNTNQQQLLLGLN